MASKTTGAVIEMVLRHHAHSGEPARRRRAVPRLPAPPHTLVAQAPRGIRPMLDNLETLLPPAHPRGPTALGTMGCASPPHQLPGADSLFQPGKSRRPGNVAERTTWHTVHRRATADQMYLRALWGRDFFLKPTSGDFESREGYQPFIEDYFLHIPDAYDDFNSEGAKLNYPA